MFNKRKSLLLGILAAATATGLALGVNGVVDAYVGEPVEVSAASQSFTRTMTTFTTVEGNVYIDGDPNVTYSCNQEDGTSAPAINKGVIRLYQIGEDGTDGGSITIKVTDDYKITSATIGSSMSTTIRVYDDADDNSANDKTGISLAANATYEASGLEASSFTFVCKGTSSSSRLYVNYLSVTYEPKTATPDDEELKSIRLDRGAGTDSVYQGEVLDTEGYVVTAVYGSDSNPDYSRESVIALDDEELIWNYDSSEIATVDLSVTYQGIVSNILTLNVIEIPAIRESVDTIVLNDLDLANVGYDTFENIVPSESESKAKYSGKAFKNGNNIQLNSGDDRGFFVSFSAGTVKAIDATYAGGSGELTVYSADKAGSTINDYTNFEGTITNQSTHIDLSGKGIKYFGLEANATCQFKSIVVTWEVDTEEIDEFVSSFFEGVTCDGGVTEPDADMWGVAELYYADLSDVHKAEIQEVTPNYEDTSTIAGVLARYDYIVGKYGTDKYNDFMGRNPSPIASALSIHSTDDLMDIAIISALAVAGIAAAGAFVFLRRKKEA